MKVLIAVMLLGIVAHVAPTEMKARLRLYLNDNGMEDRVEIGVLNFAQSGSNKTIRITGEIEGLPSGQYVLVLYAKRGRRVDCGELGRRKQLNSTHLLPALLSIDIGNQEVTELSRVLDNVTLMPNQANSIVGQQAGLHHAAGYDPNNGIVARIPITSDGITSSNPSLACGYFESIPESYSRDVEHIIL